MPIPVAGAILGGAAISGLSSLLGGAFSSFSSASASRWATKYNWQKTLEMYQRQLDDYQAYNNPAAIIQRYKRAGVNPLVGLGSSSSTPSFSQYSGAVTPQDYMGQGIAQAGQTLGNAITDIQIKQEQLKGLQKDNKAKDVAIEGAEQQNQHNANLFPIQLDLQKTTLKQYQENINKTVLENQGLKLANNITENYGLATADANLTNLKVNIASTYSGIVRSDAMFEFQKQCQKFSEDMQLKQFDLQKKQFGLAWLQFQEIKAMNAFSRNLEQARYNFDVVQYHNNRKFRDKQFEHMSFMDRVKVTKDIIDTAIQNASFGYKGLSIRNVDLIGEYTDQMSKNIVVNGGQLNNFKYKAKSIFDRK